MVRVVKTIQVQTQPLEAGSSLLSIPMFALDLSRYPSVRSVFVRARGKAPSASVPAFFTVRDLDRPTRGFPYYNMVRSYPVTNHTTFDDLLTPDLKTIITDGNRLTVVVEGTDGGSAAVLEDFHILVNVEEDEEPFHPGDTYRNQPIYPSMDIGGTVLHAGMTKPVGFTFLDTHVHLGAPVASAGGSLTDPLAWQDLDPQIFYLHEANLWGGAVEFFLEVTGLTDAAQTATTPAVFEFALWDNTADQVVPGTEVEIDFNVQEIATSSSFSAVLEDGKEYRVRWRKSNAPSDGALHFDRATLIVRQSASNINSTADFYTVRGMPVVDEAFDYGGYAIWVPESSAAVALSHYWESTVKGDGANLTSLSLIDDAASTVFSLISAIAASYIRYRQPVTGLPTAEREDGMRATHITAGVASYADARWITVSRLASQDIDYNLTARYAIATADQSIALNAEYRIIPVNSILRDGEYRIAVSDRNFSRDAAYYIDAADRSFARDGVYRVRHSASYSRDGDYFIETEDNTISRDGEYRIDFPDETYSRDGDYFIKAEASFNRSAAYAIVRSFERGAEYRVKIPDQSYGRDGAYVIIGHASYDRAATYRIARGDRSFARAGTYRVAVADKSYAIDGAYHFTFPAQTFTRDGTYRLAVADLVVTRDGTYRVAIADHTITRDGEYRIGPFARSFTRDATYRVGFPDQALALGGAYRVSRELSLSRAAVYVIAIPQTLTRDGTYRIFRAGRELDVQAELRIEVPDHSFLRDGVYRVHREDLTLALAAAYAVKPPGVYLKAPLRSAFTVRAPIDDQRNLKTPVRESITLKTPVRA